MTSLQSFSLMPHLTDDLVEEILARVPATYIKRLRSICKKWKTLFNDQRFTKKHFDKAEKESLHLLLKKNRLSRMSVNLHGPAIEFKGEFSLQNLHNDSDFKVFHCNGFLLCANRNARSTTVVWNPCTGQTKWIPTKSANTWGHQYALGYVNKKACHDYKILRFSDEKVEVEIFEFNSDSWRVSDTVNPYLGKDIGSGVSVKGNTYWIAYYNYDNHYSGFLISFDFTTERFGPRVCLPYQGYNYAHRISLYPIREDRLSVLLQNTSETEIWVTNDIVEISWSRFLRIDFNYPRNCSAPASFYIDEENKLAVVSEYGLDRTHRVYLIGEDGCRIAIPGDDQGICYVPQLFSYVPSLVQI